MRHVALLGMIVLSSLSLAAGGEVEFVEDFALAADREAALGQLIPGTEDYYYWTCLHLLNTQQFQRVDEVLKLWVARHQETPRVWEIRTRRALLTYDQNPQAALQYLRDRFGITYPHRREELNADPDLPTQLAPETISRAQFQQRALEAHAQTLQGFEDTAFQWLITSPLNPDQRRELLSRLERPDYANLVDLIVEDLNYKNSENFGNFTIHRQLLLPQLEELLKRKPELLNLQEFVYIYLSKLQPGPDEDWENDVQAKQRYLDRLQQFVDRLDQVHNSLKAHVLYHQLLLDRSQGKYDKQRLLKYLQLPRNVQYISNTLRESNAFKRFTANLETDCDGVLLLPPVGDDEPLVRSCLAHFFVDAANTKEFEPFVDDVYLQHLFAEVKIVNGLGNAEQWASLLPPEPFRELRERVDLDVDYANKTIYTAAEPVKLTLHIKNVSTLIVKVFEIDTESFYRQQGQEVDTDINLDGLVANVERTHQYQESPLRRVSRTFEFPTLNKPGVYIIDFIGNGQSSRALIRKGQLSHLVTTTPAGQRFTILDENRQQVKNARLWMSGHEFAADETGHITVPFSTDAGGHQAVVISAPRDPSSSAAGSYSSLAYFDHEAESYQFRAGFYVDRESLLRGSKATVLIRPGLYVNGTPASLKVLEEIAFTITSTDLDGTSSSVKVPGIKLFEDRETTHEFQVPPRLASLTFRLEAKITQVTTGQKIDVADQSMLTLNGIDRTETIEDLHLLKSDDQYVLEMRGRTGEPRTARPVVLTLKHRDFRVTRDAVLKTDQQGRILLGALTDIDVIQAKGPSGVQNGWQLLGNRHTYRNTVHGRVGEPVRLPFMSPAQELTRSEVSLLQLRGETYGADYFDHLKLTDGLLVIDGLPEGDYDLLLKRSRTRVQLRITAGERLGSFIVGSVRQLETQPLEPLQIESIQGADKTLKVQLRNYSKFTRVHVFASHYLPEYDAFMRLSAVGGVEPYLFSYAPARSVYLTGRNIGDEYRYIIDRKYARKYPGNMLERPSLLLNPWAVRDTQTGSQVAAAGSTFGGRGEQPQQSAAREPSAESQRPEPSENRADLDFLASSALVLTNVLPNDQGVVEIPRDALGTHQHVHVVAVDPLNTTFRSTALTETPIELRDLRLLKNLDPKLHYTQQKQVSVLPAGQTFTLHDITTGKLESYDSLASIYTLYRTLSNDSTLAEFSFLTKWPTLELDKKRELYSKYASHELSFFLFKKDPEFFRTVIQPYLANKKDKTFMDRFLLEDNLSEYVLPWNFGQLNVVEQILLAQRIAGERERTGRHIHDMFSVLPKDVERFNYLFDTAVQGTALDASNALREKQAELAATARFLSSTDKEAAPAEEAPQGGEMGGGRRGYAAPAVPSSPATRGLAIEVLKRKASDAGALEGAESMTAGEVLMEDAFYGADVAESRKQLRQLFRQLEKTKEWAENNYYHLTIDQQVASLITVNSFWNDFAAHDPKQPFLSPNLADASRNFPEMLLALAVLDLPFEAPQHESKIDDTQMTLVPGGPLVVYHEEIKPADAPDESAQLLVTQNYFKYGERERIVNGEKVDVFISGEMLIETVYGCHVVITNPTSTRQKLNALIQIPRGAISVLGGKPTQTMHLVLEPYHTQTLEYHFYFPAAGEFGHFPIHVAQNERLLAAATPDTLSVVAQPTTVDKESWDYISQHGSLEDVVTFLNTHNLQEVNLDRIAWRMQDKEAFEQVIPLLARRHIYNHTLWSYALKHDVPSAAAEYLQHADQIANECGGPLQCSLVTFDPVRRRTYEHLEYKPLVNARAHALGKRRQIVNDRLHWQYHRFLKTLAYQRQLDDAQLLTTTYYLLLQDRIQEALATFARVSRENLATQLQYDYCDAYLKFFTDDPEQARAIAARHTDDPVDRWRNTFAAIVAQLDEAQGHSVDPVDRENRDQQQGQLAATQPSFDFSVEAQKIQINFQNLKQVKINFFEIDVELLFSRNPFVQEFGDNFASIRPNHTLDVTLPADQPTATVELPESLRNSNVLIEIVAAGMTKTEAYFSNSLAVQVIENYGQVRVTDRATYKPLSKVYVKVYALTGDGQTKFFKDGYTDLRGRFDYASLSTNELDSVQKFSVLVLSDERGAVVREALPPKR